MKIILASGSSRRRELLEMMGLEFEVKVSNADETFEQGLSLEEQSKKLAYIKAKAIFDETEGDRAVIGSDTMVIKDGKIYGKPENREDAIAMLKDLSGATHKVITSICVLSQDGEKYKEQVDYDMADVFFKEMSIEEIESWIDYDEPYDKAGGYAVQSRFGVHIDKINGNFFTVMGLPIHKLYDMLKQI